MQRNSIVEGKPGYTLCGRSGFGIHWILVAVLMRRNIKYEGPAQRGKPSEKVFQFLIQIITVLECLVFLNNQVSSSPPPPSSELPSERDGIPSSSASKSKQPLQPPQNSILDEMEDEKAFANVLPDATILLWSKLLDRRGYQVTDGEVILSPSKADVLPSKTKKSIMPVSPHHHTGGSIISSFRRANSFAPAVQAKETGSSRQLPFQRSLSVAGAGAGAAMSSSNSAAVRPLEKQAVITEMVEEVEAGPSKSGSASMIFAGMIFRALGEAKHSNVRRAIDERGGRMSTDLDEDVDFVIVRLVR
jgi:hypothetical protein